MTSFSLRSFRVTAVLGLALGALAIAPVACSSGDGGGSSSGGQTCVGGVIKDGKCEAKCSPDKCITDNTCVDNQCKLTCDTHADCHPDQACTPEAPDATDADAGATVNVCEASGKSGALGTPCYFGNECDTLVACPDGGACDPNACGGKPDDCKLDEAACHREKGCTIGKCSDGTACTVSACAASDCKPLTCRTTGQGDADAYCTLADCHADSDCAPGYYCGIVRDPHIICGSNPQKPAQGGIQPCVDPANFTANGATYQEGPISLLRNMCLKRTQCAPCETDLDCSDITAPGANGGLAPTQKCVDVGGEKHCARNCAADGDCDPDYQCTNNSCVPRFGKCAGTGNFCEPCATDLDCGGTANNHKVCGNLSGDQRGCYDADLPDTCTGNDLPDKTSSDCPTSPSGKHGYCLDEAVGVQQGDSAYHHCYFPFNQTTDKFGCW